MANKGFLAIGAKARLSQNPDVRCERRNDFPVLSPVIGFGAEWTQT